jgi:tRNA A-37 threonylcarbamoyl transferase component Bud32
MKRNTFFDLVKEGWRIKIRREYKEILLELGLENPDSLFTRKKLNLLDDSEGSNIFTRQIEGEGIILKEYKPRSGKAWIDLWRPSKAMREFILSSKLFIRGIPVPEPLAAGEKRNFRLLKDYFLVAKELSGAKNLSLYVKSLHPPLSKRRIAEKREFIFRLARSIRNIHGKGFTHGDLNTSHILVKGNSFYYLDFENARLTRRASDFRWIKDLSRLNESMPSYITKTDKLRFYKEYAKGSQAKKKKMRRYLRRIEERTIKKKG